MGQGLAARLTELERGVGQVPSAALVDSVLKQRGLTDTTAGREKGSIVASVAPTVLGALTGLVAGLGLKTELANGLWMSEIWTSPFAIYGALVAGAALMTAFVGSLPRLREFSFLSTVAIAAVAMS